MSGAIWQAGEYNIVEANWMFSGGTTIGVAQQIESVILYEDLYKPFSTATVVMLDTYDLPGESGQFGRDLFKLKIETPGLPKDTQIELIFLIESIDRREMRNDRLQSYVLNLVQAEYAQDLHRTISKTFTGTGDEIAEKMLREYMQSTLPFNKEASSKQIKYTSNFWSPIKNIEYCKLHSISAKNSPLYFFYNSRKGFNYHSLDFLASQPVFQKFVGSDYITDVDTNVDAISLGETKRSPNRDWPVFLELKFDRLFDYTRIHQAGGFKSDLITHDLLTKKYKNIRWQGDQDSRTKLNPNFGFTGETYSTAGAVRITSSRYYNNHDLNDVTDSKFLQKRHSTFADLLQFKVQIDVLGRTDYTVGQKIYLDVNRPIPIMKDSDDIKDYIISGHYIITSIAHQFLRAGHVATLELSKDSTIATRKI